MLVWMVAQLPLGFGYRRLPKSHKYKGSELMQREGQLEYQRKPEGRRKDRWGKT